MNQEATSNTLLSVPGVGPIAEVEAVTADPCDLCVCADAKGCKIERHDMFTALEAQFGRTCEGTGIAYMLAAPACLTCGGPGCPCVTGEG